MRNQSFRPFIPVYNPNPETGHGVPSPEIFATIESLRESWGSGATYHQAEILTRPGAVVPLLERWLFLWQSLKDARMDNNNQEYRLRKAAELASDMIGSPSPEKTEEYETLRLDCCPPKAFANCREDLWVAATDLGLALFLGQSDDMFRLLEDQAPYALPQIPSGLFTVVRIQAAVEISRSQAPWWAWAAAKAGLLYGVEPIPPKAV